MRRRLALSMAAAGGAVVLVMVLFPVPEPRPDFSRANPTSAASAVAGSSAAGAVVRDITWSDLVPPRGDPREQAGETRLDIGTLSDSDPRAVAMLSRMREAWSRAPTVAALDGEWVRIPGYVVPLDAPTSGRPEFLLVPYFGACIHAPPPPANQIIHVLSMPAATAFRAMDSVWVSGRLAVATSESAIGSSGYRLEAVSVEKFVVPR